jgi:DNA invertase Pin-like site-specific DNA recombinase
MKVYTYARVSSIRQETEGQSLVNQERAFQTWLKQKGAVRLRSYAESKSAKSIKGREQFSRMIAELPTLKPDFVVVDTIDRFARNLEDGLSLLRQFKGLGVKLLPLEWGDPIDLDDDRDWKTVVQELTAADLERRRIRTRVKRSFAGRRERGATLHNHPPLGLIKQKDALVADPEIVEAIRHADRLFIAGKSQQVVLDYVQTACGDRAWKTLNGVRQFLTNLEYVKAGVRSIETQTRIDARLAVSKTRFGQKRTYLHPMSGVFACGVCVDDDRPVKDSLMGGNCTPAEFRSWGRSPGARIICQGPDKRHQGIIGVQESILDLMFAEIFKTLRADDNLLRSWESQVRMQQDHSQERLLQKRLGAIELKESKLPGRREQAFELLQDDDRAVVNQAKKRLSDLDAEEAVLATEREAVLRELTTAKSPRLIQSAGDLQAMLAKAAASWPKFSNERKNEIARAFCHAVSSHPRLYRGVERHPVEAAVLWPEVLPNAAYRVLYGKGIAPKVEMVATLPKRAAAQAGATVTPIRNAR